MQTLAIVAEQSPTEVATALWKALQEGLVLPQSEMYKFYVEQSTHDLVQPLQPVNYKFLDDRIQQAACALIPQSQKLQAHLRIGRLLLHNPSDTDYLFEILNHFNTSISLIVDEQERYSIAQLNLMGCQHAKASTAYSAALQHANIALSLLAADAW